jgi:dephospho-CoA kinase
MIRAGLTGGLACGKSFVGRLLEDLGCHLVRADDLGHRALSPGGEAFQAVVELFGPDILSKDATIDRKLLASKVFSDPERLAALNAIVHPAVFRLEDEFILAVQKSDPGGIVVVEAAILIESGNFRRFDRIIVVVCSEAQQVERAMHRDGCTEEEVRLRLQRQMPLNEKIRFADYLIDTSGTKASTSEQVRKVYESLRALAAAGSV